MRSRQRLTTIHGIPKNRVRSIQLRGHAGVLRTLPRKHERDWPAAGPLHRRRIIARLSQPRRKMVLQLLYGAGGRGEPKRKLASADVGRVAKVANRCARIVIQPIQELLDTGHQCASVFGGQCNQARKAIGRVSVYRSVWRGLLKDCEGIRAADSQAVQSCSPRRLRECETHAAPCSRKTATPGNRFWSSAFHN